MSDRIKVLAYCDSPTCATGFGTVSRNIFEGLYRTGRFDIEILGINYWGDPHNFPYRIWPTGTNSQRDPYGRRKICGMIPRMEFDILFLLQDSFILDFMPELMNYMKANYTGKYKSICYFPVDGIPKEQWIKNVGVADHVVTYSNFGKAEAEKACPELGKNIEIIPHGVNTSDFFPLDDEEKLKFRKRYFGRHSDKFIFTNLNRNQQRKDIPRTIQAFAEFRKHVPESILYLHMARQDQGWNLPEVCASYGFNINDDVIFPENFGPNQGYPIQVVNMIYNISDCVISTTLGEGWGYSWHEAMATKTPVIMPNNTAISENITDDRGWLVKSGTNPSLYTILPHDNEVLRPLVDVEDMVEKMLVVYGDYDAAMDKATRAYEWAITQTDWQKAVVPKWLALFDKAYEEVIAARTSGDEEDDKEKKISTEEF